MRKWWTSVKPSIYLAHLVYSVSKTIPQQWTFNPKAITTSYKARLLKWKHCCELACMSSFAIPTSIICKTRSWLIYLVVMILAISPCRPIDLMFRQHGNGATGFVCNCFPDICLTDCFEKNFNSGFYYVRSSEEMIQEWSVIREAIRESGELEQPPFNTVLCGIVRAPLLHWITLQHWNNRTLGKKIGIQACAWMIIRSRLPCSTQPGASLHIANTTLADISAQICYSSFRPTQPRKSRTYMALAYHP